MAHSCSTTARGSEFFRRDVVRRQGREGRRNRGGILEHGCQPADRRQAALSSGETGGAVLDTIAVPLSLGSSLLDTRSSAGLDVRE